MAFVIQWVENCSDDKAVVKISTPAGLFVVIMCGDVIVETDWQLDDGIDVVNGSGSACSTQQQLTQYWLNPENTFSIKLLKQGSAFRHKVWAELCQIPFGETITYSALANKIGSAARAVGNACRDNPFPLLIPCHRVVAKSGMGGYSGQTEGELLAIKQRLLAFEASH